MNLSFIKSTESDWQTVQAILQEAVDTTNGLYIAHTSQEEIVKLINTCELYLIKESDQPVGVIAYSMENKEVAYVEEVVIKPQYKGKGYGNQSMQWLMDHLKDVKKITLVTHPHNTVAIRLYLKNGFRIEKWNDNYFGDGEPRITLNKEVK